MLRLINWYSNDIVILLLCVIFVQWSMWTCLLFSAVDKVSLYLHTLRSTAKKRSCRQTGLESTFWPFLESWPFGRENEMSECFRKTNYLLWWNTNAKNYDNMFFWNIYKLFTWKIYFFLWLFRISHLTNGRKWHFWLGRKGAPPSSQWKQQQQEMEGRKWGWEKRVASCLKHQEREVLLGNCHVAELETILSSAHSSIRERTQRTEHQSHEQWAFTDSLRHILIGPRKKTRLADG